MTVSELEEAYQRLRDQLLLGELDEADFRTAVERLRFQDELGNRWKIGWYTGKWYRYDHAQWIQGTPVESTIPSNRPGAAQVPPATDDDRKRFSLAPCLVITLVGLLLVASALLIFGWNTDWWRGSPEDAAAAVDARRAEEATVQPSATPLPATATNLPTATATATPSATPSPTATRQPTVTPRPNTSTPAPTQTSTSTPTATPRKAPRTASTARVPTGSGEEWSCRLRTCR